MNSTRKSLWYIETAKGLLFRFGLLLLFLCFLFMPVSKAAAQILTVPDEKEYNDSLKKELRYGPFFGFYKDNYFLVGSTLGGKPTAMNSDVKFQISLGIRLTNNTLPWNTYLFLMYTQKAFWNVFQESMPMRDINFNPGIGLSRPFFVQDRYIGKLTLLLEHESNGKDGEASRSWNKVSLSGSALVNEWLMVHSKFWIPIVDGQNNRDILKYSGIWQAGFVAMTPSKKLSLGVTLVKRAGWNLNFNTIVDFIWRVSDKTNLNLLLQYYNGYGENMIDYNQFHSRLRVGIVFRPRFFSEF